MADTIINRCEAIGNSIAGFSVVFLHIPRSMARTETLGVSRDY